jgi:hypothetical protein
LLGIFIAYFGATKPQIFQNIFVDLSAHQQPNAIESDAENTKDSHFNLYFTPFVIWGAMIIVGGILYYFYGEPMILLGFLFGGLLFSGFVFQIISNKDNAEDEE